jgi:hypothetical protein
MYHDLTGKYVNGWVYKGGKIIGTLSKKSCDDLNTELKNAVTCFTYRITTWYEICTDWYQDKNLDGEFQTWEYTNTNCKEYSVESTYQECQTYSTGDGGGGGGGYDPPSGDPQPCNCTNTCPVCGGCLDVALLKSASADCPACSCPNDCNIAASIGIDCN